MTFCSDNDERINEGSQGITIAMNTNRNHQMKWVIFTKDRKLRKRCLSRSVSIHQFQVKEFSAFVLFFVLLSLYRHSQHSSEMGDGVFHYLGDILKSNHGRPCLLGWTIEVASVLFTDVDHTRTCGERNRR